MWSAQGSQINALATTKLQEHFISSDPMKPIYKISAYIYDNSENLLVERHSNHIDIDKIRKILSIYPQTHELRRLHNVKLVIVDNTLYENVMAPKLQISIKTNHSEKSQFVQFKNDQQNSDISARTAAVYYNLMPTTIDIFYNDAK